MIVDAEGQILGRLSSFVAKQALLGKTVIVINAEKAIVSGARESILKRNLEKLELHNLGNYTAGPFHQKRPDKYVRRVIRGMTHNRWPRGKEAYKRVMVYIGFPKAQIKRELDVDVDKEEIVKPNIKKVNQYLTVEEICRFIGGRW